MFDQQKADRVLSFFRQLKHTKGKWKGVSFSLLDWQIRALSDIFGTVRDDGLRQYNTAYLEICKKQGKSELGAGVALYCLTADGEWAAEVYGCAADRQQASIVFDVAVDMVDQNPMLKKHMKLILSLKRMVYLPTKSYYQVLSADSYSKHGFNVSAVIFDEIHAQPNRGLYDVMTEGSGDARAQPLNFIITTAGDDPDRASIGWELHTLAQDVLTGVKHDPTFYAMVYGIDAEEKRVWTGREYESVEELDWRDVGIWKKVNPSIDHTVPMSKVVDQFTRAEGNAAREKNFKWLRLNSWEKIKSSKWLGLDFWDLCKTRIDVKRLEGRPCYGGLDLSSKIDMTAFVLLFPPDDINQQWVVLPWFWVPEDKVQERVETDKVPYDEWARSGYLNTTPGNVIDYAFIENHIIGLMDKYDIQEIGYDPWNAMQTAIHLEDAGLVPVETRQGYKTMSPAMKEIEQLVLGKKIIHDGHPIMRWNVGNVEVKSDENENVRPLKGPKFERIDGLVATINAMARAIVHTDSSSIYDTHDLIVI